MTEWSKITRNSKLLAILLLISILLHSFYIGVEYEKTKGSFKSNIRTQVNAEINIEGITPYDLASAPVPTHQSDIATTSIELLNDAGNPIYFNNGGVDLNSFFEYDPPGNYYIHLDILGYAHMNNIPTTIVLLSEKGGGTGYFPSIALYQASENGPKPLQVIPLKGDRINITNISINTDYLSLF